MFSISYYVMMYPYRSISFLILKTQNLNWCYNVSHKYYFIIWVTKKKHIIWASTHQVPKAQLTDKSGILERFFISNKKSAGRKRKCVERRHLKQTQKKAHGCCTAPLVAFMCNLNSEFSFWLLKHSEQSKNEHAEWLLKQSIDLFSYPSPRARMCDSSNEGMKTLRNSAEKIPPFFMAPVFLMLSVTERRGWRKWNSLHESQSQFRHLMTLIMLNTE